MRSKVARITLAVATAAVWAMFLYLDALWNICLSQAVADGSQTYGEIYGPLSFFRPIALSLALGLSLTCAASLVFSSRQQFATP
jgi:hypothetical protein